MRVGFFDSGIGGTCILNAFRELCPGVETEYVADTEHCLRFSAASRARSFSRCSASNRAKSCSTRSATVR